MTLGQVLALFKLNPEVNIPIRRIAKLLDISPNTARSAVNSLIATGDIVSTKRGTWHWVGRRPDV